MSSLNLSRQNRTFKLLIPPVLKMKEEIPVPMTTESEFKPTLQECTPVESDYSQTIKTRTKSVSTSTCISAWSGAQSSQEEGNKGKVALAQTLGSTNVDDDEAKEKPVINKVIKF